MHDIPSAPKSANSWPIKISAFYLLIMFAAIVAIPATGMAAASGCKHDFGG